MNLIFSADDFLLRIGLSDLKSKILLITLVKADKHEKHKQKMIAYKYPPLFDVVLSIITPIIGEDMLVNKLAPAKIIPKPVA